MAGHQKITILDFGSQYTQLIARRIREQKVFCEIVPYNYSIEHARKKPIKGIVLSGGPNSVLSDDAYICDSGYFELGVPVLGICYGLQLIAKLFGGKLVKSESREYGRSLLTMTKKSQLFDGLKSEFTVWMSHGDSLASLPEGFEQIGHTKSVEFAAIQNVERKLYGLQFHPEVFHTDGGSEIIKNFLADICHINGDWDMTSFIDSQVESIRVEVGDSKLICAISGGVDSAVCAMLLSKI